MAHKPHFSALILLCVLTACLPGAGEVTATNQSSWRRLLADRLPLFGHRNWIVIADSAYPAQARDGVETVETGADQLEVIQAVLSALDTTNHVRPIVYTDAELKVVPEEDALGIGTYRTNLGELLKNRNVNSLPHEELIGKLDDAGKTFRILVLKTNLALPYTSVFLQLDCRYWDSAKEQRLRAAMNKLEAK